MTSTPASAEEVAAMVAVLVVLESERAAAAVGREPPDRLDAWVHASRVSARRTGLSRGPWRLAGRLSRRNRA
ncbi:MAG: acyl-CoA carboxylase subunit epsilon [Acidimicrobiia bacterium]